MSFENARDKQIFTQDYLFSIRFISVWLDGINSSHCKGQREAIDAFKDSVTRFFPLASLNHLPPMIIILGSYRLFSRIRVDICKSRYTTGINTRAANFPPIPLVSLIPAGNIPVSVSMTPVPICHQFQ